MTRNKYNDISHAIYATSLGLQLGIIVVIPVGLCMAAGLWADRKFGSLPLFLIIGTIGGATIAYREVYRLIKPLLKK